MSNKLFKSCRKVVIYSVMSVFAATMMAFGQDPAEEPPAPPQTSPQGWHKFFLLPRQRARHRKPPRRSASPHPLPCRATSQFRQGHS